LQPDLERRFEAGIAFLRADQVPVWSEHGGAWTSRLDRGSNPREDWNAFTTALTAGVLWDIAGAGDGLSELRAQAGDLALAARSFLRACEAPEPAGSFRFWPLALQSKPGPDVDDTALVRLALRSSGDFDDDAAVECMRLFGPYRLTAGCRPHAASAWASRFHGVFGTWMDDSNVVVDACANANVVRLLQACDARGMPGYRAAVAMLASVVGEQTLATKVTPYYRSSWMLAWLCAVLDAPSKTATPEELALRLALESRLNEPLGADASFESVLLAQSAKMRCGLAPSAAALEWLFEQQSDDGGWPPMPVCWNFAGTLGWSSRSFPSALALELLVYGLRGEVTC
jgi:hypothetical protein